MTKTFMFLPAGVCTVTLPNKGRNVSVKLEITPESADELNKQLTALKSKKPFIAEKTVGKGIQKAAFFINRFLWQDDGVYCEGEQCCEDDALKGKACAATFFTDKITDATACHVVCCPTGNPCFGELMDIKDVVFDNINSNFSVS